LGAGAGIYQTLSQSQRLAAPQTRQNRAGGDFGAQAAKVEPPTQT